MIEKTNSVIFENPYKNNIQDFTLLGVSTTLDTEITIQQQYHMFSVGDVLYFDFKNSKYSTALAINNMCSEVIGVVSKVIDNNSFKVTNKGLIKTDRYKFNPGDELYLSDSYPGKLINVQPTIIIKQIAIQASDGIIIDIQRGYKVAETQDYIEDEYESYTQEELDNIVKNIW